MARSLRKHCRKTSSVVGIVLRACGVCFEIGRKSVKGDDAHHRENLPAEPTPILEGLMNIARLRRVESSRKGRVRSQERMCRASRGGPRLEMPTLWADPSPGSQGQREGS